MFMRPSPDELRERKLQRLASECGLALIKSRRWVRGWKHSRRYALIELARYTVMFEGTNQEDGATLDEIDEYLREFRNAVEDYRTRRLQSRSQEPSHSD
jgi:hypothetical protein